MGRRAGTREDCGARGLLPRAPGTEGVGQRRTPGTRVQGEPEAFQVAEELDGSSESQGQAEETGPQEARSPGA